METSKIFKDTIKAYLDRKAEKDELFAEKYMNEKKNIDECCSFIISEVRKMNVCGLADEEVYGLAIHYYDEENIKVKKENCKVVVNHTVELTDEDKEEAKEIAMRKLIDENMKRMKPSKTEKKTTEQSLQLELF